MVQVIPGATRAIPVRMAGRDESSALPQRRKDGFLMQKWCDLSGVLPSVPAHALVSLPLPLGDAVVGS